MARLIVKNNITSGGALAVGQTLRLGGFVMTARSAAVPTMTSQVIKKHHPRQLGIRRADGSNGTLVLERALGLHHRIGSCYGL